MTALEVDQLDGIWAGISRRRAESSQRYVREHVQAALELYYQNSGSTQTQEKTEAENEERVQDVVKDEEEASDGNGVLDEEDEAADAQDEISHQEKAVPIEHNQATNNDDEVVDEDKEEADRQDSVIVQAEEAEEEARKWMTKKRKLRAVEVVVPGRRRGC